MPFQLSIVIPTWNESTSIVSTLQPLQALRKQGHQIIVVDGGSRDNTRQLAQPLADIVEKSAPGRAHQMNTGANLAIHQVLLFLHADTTLPGNFITLIEENLQTGWGRFNVRLSGKKTMFRVIEFMINLRSTVTSVATGDQAIFVTRQLFTQVGGFAEIALMEDIELSKKLRTQAKAACIKTPVITSSRRWEHYGIWKTIWMMWSLRLRYFLGASPDMLSQLYRKSDND